MAEYLFDVFFGYPGEDVDLAREIVGLLADSGLHVWFGEERVAGAWLQESIEDALRASRHAAFLVTPATATKSYTLHEIETFSRLAGPGRRMIPVEVGDLRSVSKPPLLAGWHVVSWPDSAPPHAGLWQLYCSITGREPGRRSEWEARGIELIGGVVEGSVPVRRIHENQGNRFRRLALSCDRDETWGRLATEVATERDSVSVVFGAVGQAQGYFLDRVVECLPNDPPHRVVEVHHRAGFPGTLSDAIAGLLDAFEVTSHTGLGEAIRAVLARQNLILVHRPVEMEAFERGSLREYYTEWLPRFLQDVWADTRREPGTSLKAVQAVHWPRVSVVPRVAGALLHRLGVETPLTLDASLRWNARVLLRSLVKQASKELPVVLLPRLPVLSAAHVEELHGRLRADTPEKDFVRAVIRGASDCDAVMKNILERVSDPGRSDGS